MMLTKGLHIPAKSTYLIHVINAPPYRAIHWYALTAKIIICVVHSSKTRRLADKFTLYLLLVSCLKQFVSGYMNEIRKKILIIGGLGFIGKNLYLSLVQDGHAVTMLTHTMRDEGDGFVTPEVKEHILSGSILDKAFLEEALASYDVIFSLAGSSGAADSIKDPYHDLDTNLKGHLNILEACKKINPKVLLIFPSTRLVYGKPDTETVSEQHPLRPESIYAIHKITTEQYYLMYYHLYGIRSIIYRVANPYGPYQRFGSNHYGILNWFIHKAIHREKIELYGDGSQVRDFIHIQDVIKLFKISMDNERIVGRIFNVGSGKGTSLIQAAKAISTCVPETNIVLKAWPEIDQKIETGDYISDITLVNNETGWQPLINIEDGIRETIAFYQRKVT